MPFLTADERSFAGAISELVYCNPFLPELIECERKALGPDFDEDGSAWNVHPDLAGVSQRLSRLQVLESIAAPNRRTTPGYSATVLFLKEGGIVNGRIVEDTANVIRVLNSNGEVLEVDPMEVEERRPDLSAMPEDMIESLTRQELRDLLEYVSSL